MRLSKIRRVFIPKLGIFFAAHADKDTIKDYAGQVFIPKLGIFFAAQEKMMDTSCYEGYEVFIPKLGIFFAAPRNSKKDLSLLL